MHETSSAQPAQSGDCGCGCNGTGDCDEAKQPANRARRALMFGAGAGTVALVSTLANRRAFAAAQCGAVSHAMSLNPSGSGQQAGCGGLTPGFWKNHIGCAGTALGFSVSRSNPNYTTELNDFLENTTLGSKLSNLGAVDLASSGDTFAYAFCNPSSDASHWACAILDALTPQWNPSYGYNIVQLNDAILAAFHNNVSGMMILTALETLEDSGISGPGNSVCPNMSLKSC